VTESSTAASGADLALPDAVLWDMDGTIVDTEPYWQQSQIVLVAEHGGTWSREDGDSLIGSGLWQSARVLQDHGVDLGEQEIIDRMTDDVMVSIRRHLPWRPGARELLREVRAAGIPTALVTMSIRRMADFVAEAIDFQAFDIVVAGDEVEFAKPHPEPYLRAATALGVDIRSCIAIEDSPTGLASAMAAGATAIGVEHHAPLSTDGGYTHRASLEGVSLHELRHILHAARTPSNLSGGKA